MGQYTVTLSKEEEKALLTDMASIQDWINNVIYNKARQCMDRVNEEALKPNSEMLTNDDLIHIRRMMDEANLPIVVVTPKALPNHIKGEVVRRAKIKSATERQAELEKTK